MGREKEEVKKEREGRCGSEREGIVGEGRIKYVGRKSLIGREEGNGGG